MKINVYFDSMKPREESHNFIVIDDLQAPDPKFSMLIIIISARFEYY